MNTAGLSLTAENPQLVPIHGSGSADIWDPGKAFLGIPPWQQSRGKGSSPGCLFALRFIFKASAPRFSSSCHKARVCLEGWRGCAWHTEPLSQQLSPERQPLLPQELSSAALLQGLTQKSRQGEVPSLSCVFHEEEKKLSAALSTCYSSFPLVSLAHTHFFILGIRLSSWKSHFCNAWVVNYHIHCFPPPKDCKNIKNILGTDSDNPANVQ